MTSRSRRWEKLIRLMGCWLGIFLLIFINTKRGEEEEDSDETRWNRNLQWELFSAFHRYNVLLIRWLAGRVVNVILLHLLQIEKIPESQN